jgi:formamidopyrimidine-DNA glycosylase
VKDIEGRTIEALSRLGKRLVWHMGDEIFVVIHLMIAGRFRWKPPGEKIPGKVGLAAFDFPNGTLILTEAGTKRRASMHLVRGQERLHALHAGGLDVMGSSSDEFAAAVTAENHTLKRTLTDPHLLDGIGNAYSDEILHDAQLSPMQLTSRLSRDEVDRLRTSSIRVLTGWRDRLIAETGDAFPEKVTAFREGMAAHGRYGKPCPRCGTPIQRIRYASNEANYCPTCQTGGRLLADRALSRLLRDDWPRSLEALDELKQARRVDQDQKPLTTKGAKDTKDL